MYVRTLDSPMEANRTPALRPAVALAVLTTIAACSSPPSAPRALESSSRSEPAPATQADADAGAEAAPTGRLALLDKLGAPRQFLIGHGNDLPGEYTGLTGDKPAIYGLPHKLDIHYAYLSGVADETLDGGPSWPHYEPDGGFVTTIANMDAAKGVTPMFTLYQHAARGEKNFAAFRDEDFMTKYWRGVRLLFTRLGAFGKPAMVHLEPDLWGFAQEAHGDDPANMPVLVGGLVPECRDLPDDVSGLGRCIVRLSRAISPKVLVGMHASGFGALGEPKRVAAYLTKVGAREGDFIVLETLDRDAGCFEAKIDQRCQRDDGALYWDESNQRSPNFHDHLRWVREIHAGLGGMPVMWWQMPLGVPSDDPGGAPGRYRDNRVRYLFEHTDEFAGAGGFAAVFGVGAPNQTNIQTDGGQFSRAITKYYASPLPIAQP
jgi:hypothetical protein